MTWADPDHIKSGHQWPSNAITYRWVTDGSVDRAPTAGERSAAAHALATWAKIADLRFTEIDGPADIDFRIDGRFGTSAGDYPPIGDVFIEPGLATAWGDFAPGTYSWLVILHEIGHALGLSHPHESGNLTGSPLDASRDNMTNTLMSYNWEGRPPGLEDLIVQAPWTPMALDVLAIRALYGQGDGTAGNDTWAFHDPRSLSTIADTAGTDLLDASDLTLPSQIDLRPGEWSTFGVSALGIRGAAFNAWDSLVENAKGGSADDLLIGNGLANRLEGGAGDDVLIGLTGNDTLVGGKGVDHFVLDYWSRDTITDWTVGETVSVIDVDDLEVIKAIKKIHGASGSVLRAQDDGLWHDVAVLVSIKPKSVLAEIADGSLLDGLVDRSAAS